MASPISGRWAIISTFVTLSSASPPSSHECVKTPSPPARLNAMRVMTSAAHHVIRASLGFSASATRRCSRHAPTSPPRGLGCRGRGGSRPTAPHLTRSRGGRSSVGVAPRFAREHGRPDHAVAGALDDPSLCAVMAGSIRSLRRPPATAIRCDLRRFQQADCNRRRPPRGSRQSLRVSLIGAANLRQPFVA
jgi:hypothetical protein